MAAAPADPLALRPIAVLSVDPEGIHPRPDTHRAATRVLPTRARQAGGTPRNLGMTFRATAVTGRSRSAAGRGAMHSHALRGRIFNRALQAKVHRSACPFRPSDREITTRHATRPTHRRAQSGYMATMRSPLRSPIRRAGSAACSLPRTPKRRSESCFRRLGRFHPNGSIGDGWIIC
jgi:hypothetical protein